MPKNDDQGTQKITKTGGDRAKNADRQQRLSEALRANLRRRKAQKRGAVDEIEAELDVKSSVMKEK